MEILNRIVKTGDLVVAKGSGVKNRGLRIGIVMENSIRFLEGYGNYTEVYLISNPSSEELLLKQQILDQLELEKKNKLQQIEKVKTLNTINKKDLQIGQWYKDEKNNNFMYLGFGKVTLFDKPFSEWRILKEETGYIYISENGKNEIDNELSYRYIESYNVKKTNKKLISTLNRKINISEKTIELIDDQKYSIPRNKQKIKIEIQKNY